MNEQDKPTEEEHDANETLLVQNLTRVTNERDSARRAAAAFYRYIMASAEVAKHRATCKNCYRDATDCAEAVRLVQQSNIIFGDAWIVAQEYKP